MNTCSGVEESEQVKFLMPFRFEPSNSNSFAKTVN